MKTIKLIFLSFVLCSLPFGICYAQWVPVTNGMGNVGVGSLAYSGNNIFAGTGGQGVYLSTNNGTNWNQTPLNNVDVQALAVNGNNVFAGKFLAPNHGVYVSTNNGINWTQTLINQVRSLAINGSNIFAGASTPMGVFLSTNNGTNWTQTSLNYREVPSLAVKGDTIFAGTINYGVYLSTDNGTSWTQTSLNNPSVRSLAINGNTIYAGTSNPSNGVYISTNNGTSWTQTSLNNRSVYSLAVNGNYIFAGTQNYGVYVYNGTSWEQRNEGLGNLNVNALCIINNYIFAGTGAGVYRRPLSELVGIQPISNEIPNQFSLLQNYPNPFNPSTVISFQLAVNSFASLKVYDILGREVATLVNEQLQPGTYEVDWDGSKFASGVYYYKLIAGNYIETKKMVLIK